MWVPLVSSGVCCVSWVDQIGSTHTIHHRCISTKAVAGEIAALRLAMTPPAAAGEVRPDCSGPAARRRRHAVSRGVVLAEKPIVPVASFTVHLKLAAHSPVLRCGHVPFCLIHSASLPCRYPASFRVVGGE